MSLQSENVRFVQSRNVRFHGWPRALWKRSESPLIIEHGADLTVRNNKGKTVIETAKRKGPFDEKLSARQFKVRTSVSRRPVPNKGA